MRRTLLFLLFLVVAVPAVADTVIPNQRLWIGTGRIFNNDQFGDTHDRWRSGSYGLSFIRGPKWQDKLPSQAGEIVEYRLRSEIIAPADLTNPVLGGDRRYVGALSFGMFTHFERGGDEISAGIDLVVTGPQTGVGLFQTQVHQLTGYPIPAVLDSQIPNGIHPTVNVEIARNIEIRNNAGVQIRFRPFVEVQAGVETFLRVGGDFTFGELGRGDLMVRDVVTGQRVVAVRGSRAPSHSIVLGGDVAFVANSVYLPAASGYTLVNPRIRLRAGRVIDAENYQVFYGLTWLGKEFAAQTSGQVVGSVSVKIVF